MSNSLIKRAGGKLVTLRDDLALFKSLWKFAESREELADKLNIELSPKAILTKIDNLAEDEEFAEVLGTLGLLDEAKKIQGLIKDIREKHGAKLDALETLLTPVGSFHEQIAEANGLRKVDAEQAEIDWDVISFRGNLPNVKKTPFGLDFSADLALSIDAAAEWPFSEELPQPLLSMGLAAEAAVNGEGSLAFSPGFLKVGAGVEKGVEVDFFYHVSQPKSVVALEVLSRLPKLPNFLSYDDLWAAFADPKLGLEGIRFRYDSELDFDLNVGLGQKFTFAKDLGVEAGLAVKVGVRRPSSLELTFMAGEDAEDGGRKIIAKLSRDKAKERLYGVSAGLTLDLTSLAPRVHALLKEALEKWDEVLREVKPFLSPGTYIKSQLDDNLGDFVAELVGDEALSKALTADLRLLLGSDAENDLKVADWLVEQLTAELDKVGAGKFLDADDFEGWVEDAAKSATFKIASRLPRIGGSELTKDLEKKIVDLAKGEAAKLHSAFIGEITKAFNENSAGLAKELKRLGNKRKKALNSLDDALKGVRDLVDRYDNLFREIVKATEDSAWAKISASIFIEEAREDSTAMQISGTFLDDRDNAKDVFDAMLHGKIQSAATVLSDDNPSFDLNHKESSITRFTKSSSKLGYEFVLFGFSLNGTKLMSGQAKIKTGGDGSITVDSKGTAEVDKGGRGEDRKAIFTTASSILLARAAADQPPDYDRSIDLGLSFLHEDERMSREELSGLIQSLIDVDLLDKADLDRALAVFNQWGGKKGRKARLRANVDIRLGLGRKGMLTLLGLGDNSTEPELSAQGKERIAAAYRAMRAKFDDAGDKESHIEDYQKMIAEMRRIYLSRPAGLVAPEGAQLWSKEQYEDAEERIAKLALGRIKHLNKSGFKFGRRLDDEFLIFIATLKYLSSNHHDDGTVAEHNWATNVIVTHQPKNKRQEVLVLT